MRAFLKHIFVYFIDKIIGYVRYRHAHDLEYELSLGARKSSAEYLWLNMAGVSYLKDKYSLLSHSLSMAHNDGLYLEFGVYKGASINYIAKNVSQTITIYGFDAFTGLPNFWRPGYGKGLFDLGGNLPKVASNVSLQRGWFNETLPAFINKHKQSIAFIHIDCDLYSSTKTIFNELSDCILPGCIIVFDEYLNHPGWQENEFRAFQEFIQDTGRKYEYIGYVCNDEQVAVRII
jgi:predicted O-methyltransferase YrrM